MEFIFNIIFLGIAADGSQFIATTLVEAEGEDDARNRAQIEANYRATRDGYRKVMVFVIPFRREGVLALANGSYPDVTKEHIKWPEVLYGEDKLI